MAILVFVLLYAPIAILAAYSFNAGTSIAIWEGFSLRWYARLAEQRGTGGDLPLARHRQVAAVVSSMLATMAAIATTRTAPFRGQTIVLAMINLPLMAPEIVTAIALLIFFALLKIATGYAGIGYIVLAHTAFCMPFAFLPIRGRLEGMDQSLETAAADLYATPWRAFRWVTLPLLWPGILAGLMLAFVISLDDVVITNLIAGPGQETLPIYMLAPAPPLDHARDQRRLDRPARRLGAARIPVVPAQPRERMNPCACPSPPPRPAALCRRRIAAHAAASSTSSTGATTPARR